MEHKHPLSITGAYNGRVNRLLSPCVVSDAWNPAGSNPKPKRVQFMALWDTGATHSAITQKVVDACGLEHDGLVQEAHHAYGTATNVEKFYVNFVLPNKVEITSIPVTLGQFPGADILIGMDVINMGDFAVTNKDGKTKFSFRIPSIADIDFVVEDNERIREERERKRTEEFLKAKGSGASRSSKSRRKTRNSRSR